MANAFHKEDGTWELFSDNYLTKIRITFLEETIDYGSSDKEVKDIPLGFSTKRKTTDSKWIKFKKSEINGQQQTAKGHTWVSTDKLFQH